MNKLILLFLILCPAFTHAKDYQVKLHIRNLPADSRPILLKMYNGDMYVLDSTSVRLNDSTVTFQIADSTNPGMLRAILGIPAYSQYTNAQPIAMNFLFNKEDVELRLDYNSPEASTEVLQSEENRVYFNFLREDALFFRKLGLLEQIVLNYPAKDEFYVKAQDFYKKFQQQRDKFIDKTYSTNRNMLAAKIIKNQKMPYTAGNLTANERATLYQDHFLDNVDFNDTLLLYTPLYTDKIYQYIQMNMKREGSPRENEASVIKALDKIVPRLAVNTIIQQHILQFLINGFEAMKMEEVLAHISNNYLQQCGSSSEIIKRRLEGYRKMAVGQSVPDFTIIDMDHNPVNLYSGVNPYTLIIFWHTECGHCQDMMKVLPQMISQEFFQKHQVKIIGISIDENRGNWEKFSAAHPMNWVNTHVEGAFDSEIAVDYNLFATPTMFLLDDTNTIIAKPTTIGELKKNIMAL